MQQELLRRGSAADASQRCHVGHASCPGTGRLCGQAAARACPSSRPPSPEASAPPVTSELPPKPQGPAVVKDGSALRLVGIGDAKFVDWVPSGQTALVEASPALYRLRLDTRELHPMPDLGSVQNMGWAGPDAALLIRWSGDAPALGELSLLTGEWRPLARVSGRVQLCQSGSHWVWVDVKVVRQGGAGGREIGAVYRAPVPKPAAGSAPQPLDGKQVLEQAPSWAAWPMAPACWTGSINGSGCSARTATCRPLPKGSRCPR